VILRDATSAGKEYFVLNTHWDHVSQAARLHSAKLIRKKLSLAGDRPLIVMGDMNVDDANPALTTLLGPGESGTSKLQDSYRHVMPERGPDEATFHAFRGTTTGNRIDYVLHSPDFQATDAEIIRTDFTGRYSSDHFPVVVVLQP
jgi:endonuclease/exonuclease/phosphatase family metal-dependent hydrolase